MNNEIQNDPEYLRNLVLVTRERLANALVTITELEALVTFERQRAIKAEQQAAELKKED
jgi:hypothetical protein